MMCEVHARGRGGCGILPAPSRSSSSRAICSGRAGGSNAVFSIRVGVTPKNLASVFRFHAAYKRIRTVPDGRYGMVALDHYYDQSHFIRDFKRFTGMTPRLYAQTADYGRFYIPATSDLRTARLSRDRE